LNPSLRILILTPTAFPSTTGNAITVERWRRSLIKQGYVVQALATEDLDVSALRQLVSDSQPDLIHIHHAFRTGQLLFDPSIESMMNGRALVVSPGGTDIHLDTKEEGRRKIITQVFEKTKAIIVQSEEMMRSLLGFFPSLQDRIVMIPKSYCWMGEEEFNLRGAVDCSPEDILFFLPAGVRPVKGNLEVLRLLERAQTLRRSIRAVFAGPVLEKEYAGRFEQEVKRLHIFARWLSPIPPQAMRSAYQGADVILNNSFSEGLSNLLLEAKASGKPILASNIPANRQPVLGNPGDLPAGLLYDPHSPEDFLKQALRLADDRELRKKLGQAGKDQTARLPRPEEEARGLIRVYEKALDKSLTCYHSFVSSQEMKKGCCEFTPLESPAIYGGDNTK
jgi:glycosyltransferase involved in cell wall biosynthesis